MGDYILNKKVSVGKMSNTPVQLPSNVPTVAPSVPVQPRPSMLCICIRYWEIYHLGDSTGWTYGCL